MKLCIRINNGIFYFGINNFVSLAENMFICGYKEKWGSFFQFYERTQKHIVIDLNFVRMLYFVDVQSEDNLLISAMDFFNKGELIGNSNFAHGKHPVCLDKSA